MSTTYMTARLKLADGTIVFPQGTLDNMAASLQDHTVVPASTFTDGAAALANQAPTFDATAAYVVGDYVLYNRVLYRFKADHAAGAWTGTDAVAVKIAADVTSVQNEVDSVFAFDTPTAFISDGNGNISPELTLYQVEGSNGYISEFGNFVTHNDYRTYTYVTPIDTEIWVGDSGVFDIAIYTGTTVTSTDLVAIYRNSQGNLPTENSKVKVAAGKMIAVCAQRNSGSGITYPVAFQLHLSVPYKALRNDVNLDAAQIAQVSESLIAPPFDIETNYSAGDYVTYGGMLYRFQMAHTAGAWAGTDAVAVLAAAEVEAVTDKLESAVSSEKAVVFSADGSGYVSPELTRYEPNGYISATGNFTQNNDYIVYLYTPAIDTPVWVGDGVRALGIYNSTTLSSSTVVTVYTTGNNNLPTEANPVIVKAGKVIAIGTTKVNGASNQWPRAFDVHLNIPWRQLASDIKLADSQIVQCSDAIKASGKKLCCKYRMTNGTDDRQIYYSDKATHVLSVFVPTKKGYVQYNIGKSANDTQESGGFEVTRMCVLYAANDDFSKRFDITRPGEWEMAIQLDGRPDFIGGYEHGDEWETECTYYLDGEVVDVTTLTALTEFTELRVVNNSNMYDPNDHTTLVGIHGREWVFTKDSATLYQSVMWQFQTTTTMSVSYMTMLPMIRGNDAVSADQITSDFYSDTRFAITDCSVGGFPDGMLPETTRKISIYGTESGVYADTEVLEYPYYPGKGTVRVNSKVDAANKLYWCICHGGGAATKQDIEPGTIWKSKTVYKFEITEGTAERDAE